MVGGRDHNSIRNMKKVIETPIQTRFADIDMFRHVNNVRQQEYLDLGKMDYYRRVVGLNSLTVSPTLMIVATKSDFIDQVRYEDRATVRSWVERIGTKSITLRQQIVCNSDSVRETPLHNEGSASGQGGRICTESETVLVAFDLRTQQTLAIPDEWRTKIAE